MRKFSKQLFKFLWLQAFLFDQIFCKYFYWCITRWPHQHITQLDPLKCVGQRQNLFWPVLDKRNRNIYEKNQQKILSMLFKWIKKWIWNITCKNSYIYRRNVKIYPVNTIRPQWLVHAVFLFLFFTKNQLTTPFELNYKSKHTQYISDLNRAKYMIS